MHYLFLSSLPTPSEATRIRARRKPVCWSLFGYVWKLESFLKVFSFSSFFPLFFFFLFIHSFNRYLMSALFLPDTVLSARDIAVTKQTKIPAFMHLTLQSGERNNLWDDDTCYGDKLSREEKRKYVCWVGKGSCNYKKMTSLKRWYLEKNLKEWSI